MTSTTTTTIDQERADLLDALATHRAFLRQTVQGLDDEQATRRTTVSELTLAGLIKHVTQVEANWCRFITEGPSTMEFTPAAFAEHADGFRLLAGETLEGVLARYDEVAAATDDLVRTTDLNATQPLPTAPWFAPGATRSARRAVVHLLAEIAQHAGHADIIRESLDGQKTMG